MQTYEQQLDKLEASPPIILDSVDFCFRQPEILQNRLGHIFNYFCRVESEVSKNTEQIHYLFPESDGTTQRFLNIWLRQEEAHGRIFSRSLDILSMNQPEVDRQAVTNQLRIARLLGKIPGFGPVLMMNYLSRGAMHERLTASGYRVMKQLLLEQGETSFVRTAIEPIEQQEAGHLGYYSRAAKDLRHQLSAWQLCSARWLAEKTYRPVGVGNSRQLADFGGVALTLVGPDTASFAAPVQALANQLLGAEAQGLKVPYYVHKCLGRAIAAYMLQ